MPVEHRITRPDQRHPEREELSHLDESEWPIGFGECGFKVLEWRPGKEGSGPPRPDAALPTPEPAGELDDEIPF